MNNQRGAVLAHGWRSQQTGPVVSGPEERVSRKGQRPASRSDLVFQALDCRNASSPSPRTTMSVHARPQNSRDRLCLRVRIYFQRSVFTPLTARRSRLPLWAHHFLDQLATGALWQCVATGSILPYVRCFWVETARSWLWSTTSIARRHSSTQSAS